MIIWYFDINEFPSKMIYELLDKIPNIISSKIKKLHQINDKKSKLISKILLHKYFSEINPDWSLTEIKKEKNNKPYVDIGVNFNISHSGKYIIIVFSKTNIVGIDIEEVKNIDVLSLSNYFHKDESIFLKNNNYDIGIFYDIWTRKESVLKAIGIGVMEGLNKFSVIEDIVYSNLNTKWYLKTLEIEDNYKSTLCSSSQIDNYLITKINFLTLKKYINEKILF